MLRRRMLNQIPFSPSISVNDAYFYVQAPWIKDLSKYNMSVDRSSYMDIDKYNGKYVFSMGRMGAYQSFIRFENDSNISPYPQPDNEISIEALLYLNTQQEGRYYLFAPYGIQSITQNQLCIGVNVSSFGTKLFYTGGRSIDIPAYQWVHVMASWRKGHLREYIGGVLNYEDEYNVTNIKEYQTYYFNIGGYPSAYDMGLPGMFRYVRIWNYAKNFDLDKFVPDP